VIVRIDASVVPPGVTLDEADDFTAFKVVIDAPAHAFVAEDQLKRLAGDRATDPAWLRDLDGMAGYARSKGWVREDGTIQAHVEVRS
jgi:hypothetical protein